MRGEKWTARGKWFSFYETGKLEKNTQTNRGAGVDPVKERKKEQRTNRSQLDPISWIQSHLETSLEQLNMTSLFYFSIFSSRANSVWQSNLQTQGFSPEKASYQPLLNCQHRTMYYNRKGGGGRHIIEVCVFDMYWWANSLSSFPLFPLLLFFRFQTGLLLLQGWSYYGKKASERWSGKSSRSQLSQLGMFRHIANKMSNAKKKKLRWRESSFF